MVTVLLRHHPELAPALAGVTNAFAPWRSLWPRSRPPGPKTAAPPWPACAPTPRPARPRGPLRASAEAIDRRGPEAEAFRRQVETLAARCVTAADGLTLSATHMEAYERPR
ncbi:hypothetical protein [Streptomyces sp. WM6368]|uniref:hypothetical protein n=1 Tax=Streptomyces sp. WM6368 TaxID=1415554 RepID=UPI0006AF7434|nr:hypothetical protein [Streptomyces sp. WM6368]KOU27851.1 hypothetical protein ADK51_12140 [Streptomyces sp. WM6368]